MDFKKIGQIFIVTFIFLNIYLIYGIVERKDIQQTSSQSTDYNLFSSMEEMDITLPDLTEVKKDEQEIYSVQANAHQLMEKEIEANDLHTGSINEEGVYYVSFLSSAIQLEGNPIDGFKEEDYEVIQEYVLSDQVMFGSEYGNLKYDQDGRRFVLFQCIDGIPIIDGSSEISLFVNDEGQVYSYEQTYAGPVTRQGNPLNLIDAKRAIEILFINNEIRENFKIEKPVLAYHRALHLEDLSMYSPLWLIDVSRSSDRDNFRVDAVNGTIIRHQSTPKVDSKEEDASEDIEEDE